ncbi:alanine dehydrogenase [Chloroflexota bacterium]
MDRKVRLINMAEVEQTLSMTEVLKLVEQAFMERGKGRAQMPPKSYIFFSRHNGDLRVMPAYLEELNEPGVKLVNVHPDNPAKHGIPTVLATILLFDPDTGTPVCIMDGTFVTTMRTAAASGVAVKYLARKDSRVLGVVGAGGQSLRQVEAINEVLKLEQVKVFDVAESRANELARTIEQRFGLSAKGVSSAEEVAKGSDVIVTVTPSSTPVVHDSWVGAGTHISAIGADAAGKEELEPALLKRAKIVVDDWEQASHSGEINVPVAKGVLTHADIHADIGEVVAGQKKGRTSETEITVFDSTGLAIQDVITAWHAYRVAMEKGLGSEIAPLYLRGQ